MTTTQQQSGFGTEYHDGSGFDDCDSENTGWRTCKEISDKSKWCSECVYLSREDCDDCEGKCRANETEECEKCKIKLRIGCANNPSNHSVFNGCCDDCREDEYVYDPSGRIMTKEEKPMESRQRVGKLTNWNAKPTDGEPVGLRDWEK